MLRGLWQDRITTNENSGENGNRDGNRTAQDRPGEFVGQTGAAPTPVN